MNSSKKIQSALMSILAVVAFSFAMTSCNSEKDPADLIQGTWTGTVSEGYVNDTLYSKIDYATGIESYYDLNGEVIKSDTSNVSVSLTIDKTTFVLKSEVEEDGKIDSDEEKYTYTVKKEDGTTYLTLVDETDSLTFPITLTKNKLALNITLSNGDDYVYRLVMNFKK